MKKHLKRASVIIGIEMLLSPQLIAESCSNLSSLRCKECCGDAGELCLKDCGSMSDQCLETCSAAVGSCLKGCKTHF